MALGYIQTNDILSQKHCVVVHKNVDELGREAACVKIKRLDIDYS